MIVAQFVRSFIVAQFLERWDDPAYHGGSPGHDDWNPDDGHYSPPYGDDGYQPEDEYMYNYRQRRMAGKGQANPQPNPSLPSKATESGSDPTKKPAPTQAKLRRRLETAEKERRRLSEDPREKYAKVENTRVTV
jgi:hypothetical protein